MNQTPPDRRVAPSDPGAPSPRPAPRHGRHALLLGALACPAATSGAELAPRERPDASTGPAATTEPAAEAVAIAGQYRFIGGDKERQALLDAIEDVIADMNFIARPIARKRLRESNLPSAELHLVVTADEITVARPGRPTVSAPRDGSTITWESPDGDEFQVRHRLVDDKTLVQEFVGDGNRSENVFSLDGDRVTVATTIEADRLPKVLRFRMTYRRKR